MRIQGNAKTPEIIRLLGLAKQEHRTAELLLNYLSNSELQAGLHVARGWELLVQSVSVSKDVTLQGGSVAIGQLKDEPWMHKNTAFIPEVVLFVERFCGPVSDLNTEGIISVKLALDLLRDSLSAWISSQGLESGMHRWHVVTSFALGIVLVVVAYIAAALSFGHWNPSFWLEQRVGAFRVIESSQEWGQLQINRNVSGGRLRVGGVDFEEGPGTHSRSYVRLRLPGGLRLFQVGYGIDDAGKDAGEVVFKITSKGKELFNSGIVKGGQPAGRAVVSVEGLSELELIVERGPDNSNYSDHANWLNPAIVK